MVLIIFYLLASFTFWDLFWISDIAQWDEGGRLLFVLFCACIVHLDMGIAIAIIRRYK